jgi:hypothetical protein
VFRRALLSARSAAAAASAVPFQSASRDDEWPPEKRVLKSLSGISPALINAVFGTR